MSSRAVSSREFNKEILGVVFSFCTPQEVGRAENVAKLWQKVAHDIAYRYFLLQIDIKFHKELPIGVSYKQIFLCELLNTVQAQIRKVPVSLVNVMSAPFTYIDKMERLDIHLEGDFAAMESQVTTKIGEISRVLRDEIFLASLGAGTEFCSYDSDQKFLLTTQRRVLQERLQKVKAEELAPLKMQEAQIELSVLQLQKKKKKKLGLRHSSSEDQISTQKRGFARLIQIIGTLVRGIPKSPKTALPKSPRIVS